jgi:serine/threonine-protein kinase HipA
VRRAQEPLEKILRRIIREELSRASFRPARTGELSTHIAKLPSGESPGIVELEYLTTIAAKALLPEDEIVEIEVAAMREIEGPCLLVRRFDRTLTGEKIHFEEFNQLRGQSADAKYEGSY